MRRAVNEWLNQHDKLKPGYVVTIRRDMAPQKGEPVLDRPGPTIDQESHLNIIPLL